jgi:hypothetical protein
MSVGDEGEEEGVHVNSTQCECWIAMGEVI